MDTSEMACHHLVCWYNEWSTIANLFKMIEMFKSNNNTNTIP